MLKFIFSPVKKIILLKKFSKKIPPRIRAGAQFIRLSFVSRQDAVRFGLAFFCPCFHQIPSVSFRYDLGQSDFVNF